MYLYCQPGRIIVVLSHRRTIYELLEILALSKTDQMQISLCKLRERERERPAVDTIRRCESRTDPATSWHLFAFSLSRC